LKMACPRATDALKSYEGSADHALYRLKIFKVTDLRPAPSARPVVPDRSEVQHECSSSW
jgi:hypothetical protein